MPFLVKLLTNLLVSKVASKVAEDVVLATLKHWASKTDNELDDKLVKTIETSLKS
ncbi:hypothetical protein DNAM_120 [Pseudomonas phage BroderSalsa]|nr:hypothetical protein DNAM_120 [Pseudomonas phage BroderSalsa]